MVLMRLVWSLEELAAVTTDTSRRRVLADQAERTLRHIQQQEPPSAELNEVQERARALAKSLPKFGI